MTNCLSILFWSHGSAVVPLIILQSLISLCCFVATVAFVWKHSIQQKRIDQKNKQNKSIHQKLYRAQLVLVPLILSLNGIFITINYLFDLHQEVKPIGIDGISDNYSSWVDYVNSECNLNITTITEIVTIFVSLFSMSGYVGVLSLYFTRLVVLFDGSMFSVSKKSTTMFYTCFICILMVGVGLIPIYFCISTTLSRIIVICAIGLSNAWIIILALLIHRLLRQRFKSLIRMILNAGQSNHNFNSNDTKSQTEYFLTTLNRLTVLFLVSLVTSAVGTIVLVTIIICGLYYGNQSYVAIVRGICAVIAINDLFIYIVCIILQFPYMDTKFGLYSKCCGVCHQKYNQQEQIRRLNVNSNVHTPSMTSNYVSK